MEMEQDPDPELQANPSTSNNSTDAEVAPEDSAETKTPRKRTLSDTDPDDGLLCPVCFEAWTAAGSHRLVSLKCGHLFGLSCVQRWLLITKKCPTCKVAVRKNNIREIYATKLVALDNTELEESKLKIKRLEMEIAILKTQNSDLEADLQAIKRSRDNLTNACSSINSYLKNVLFNVIFKKTTHFDGGSCRVLAYAPSRDIVAVSYENNGPLWRGFGVRLISNECEPFMQIASLHTKEIRDMEFHPINQDLLLTVSFDCIVQIHDISENKVFFKWKAEEAIWCTCWGPDNCGNVVAFIGTSRGRVFRLNTTSNTPESVQELPPEERPVPVCSLKLSNKLRCLLCCRMLSVKAYVESNDDEFQGQLLMQGSYSAMTFNEEGASAVMVICSRPTTCEPREKYVSYKLTTEHSTGTISCTVLHVIHGGEQTSQLTRPCLLATRIGLLFIAYLEASSTVCIWLVGQDQKACTIKTSELIKHVLANRNDNLYLLGANKIIHYKLPTLVG